MDERIIVFDDMIYDKKICLDLFRRKIQIRNISDIIKNEKVLEHDVEEFISNIRRKSRKRAVIGIVTTYKCNLNCTYCYEKGYQREDVSVEFEDIICFIKEYVLQHNFEEIRMIFTGGEPFLNKKMILHISKEISEFLSAYNISFNYSVVTNGTIDFENCIDKMREYGLDLIQVSLDGTKEIHNSRRKASFDVYALCWNTIKRLSKYDSVKIIIRTNIDTENIPYIENMLKEFDVISKSNISFDFFPTEKTYCDRKEGEEEILNIKDILNIYKIVKKHNFNANKSNPFFRGCMSFVEEGCFIDLYGNIYKCGGYLGHNTEALGNIKDSKDICKIIKSYINRKLKAECKTCGLFPVCLGGCLYQKHYSEVCSEEYKEKIKNQLRLQTMLYLMENNLLEIERENLHG